jgi:cupin fold WbuC family metalloprotein
LSELATISRHEQGLLIDAPLLDLKAASARDSPRGREIHVLHDGDTDNPQRMLNAIEPGSYVTPHRHALVPKAESLVLLRGCAAVVIFDDDGAPQIEALLSLQAQGPGVGVAFDLRAGVWHTMLALETGTILYEMKGGPYDPRTDKQFPPWAPQEGTAESRSYLAQLEDRLRRRFALSPRPWQI